MSAPVEMDAYLASAAIDGFVGVSREIVQSIRDVERAAGQYDFHAGKPTTTRDQRIALQNARIAARRALCALLVKAER